MRHSHPNFFGIFLLLVFWSLSLFVYKTGGFFQSTLSPNNTAALLSPWTLSEKMLLGFSISPNDLSIKDWERLPRIGPKLARRIVENRQSHGPFENLQALTRVSGIGEKTVELLQPFFQGAASKF